MYIYTTSTTHHNTLTQTTLQYSILYSGFIVICWRLFVCGQQLSYRSTHREIAAITLFKWRAEREREK